jgi:hypothetical protein
MDKAGETPTLDFAAVIALPVDSDPTHAIGRTSTTSGK